MEIYCVKEVEQNPLSKSQTKPFYIGTKEAPSDTICAEKSGETIIEAGSEKTSLWDFGTGPTHTRLSQKKARSLKFG